MLKKLCLLMAVVMSFTMVSLTPITGDAQGVLTIVSSTPENLSTNFNILDNATITFSDVLNADTVNLRNVVISTTLGAISDYTVNVNPMNNKILEIVFTKELKYDTIYTVSVQNVASPDGSVVGMDANIKFTTMENPAQYLYYNNFNDGDTTGLKLENSATVENGKLKIVGSWAPMPKVTILGGDTWSDYEASYSYKGTADSIMRTMIRYVDDDNSYRTYMDCPSKTRNMEGVKNYDVSMPGTAYTFDEAHTYNANFSVIGNTLIWSEDNEVVLTKPDAQWCKSGTFGLMAFGGTILYDDLFIKDKTVDPLTFTASNLKNIMRGDTVTIDFGQEMKLDTLVASNVVFSDGTTTIPVTVAVSGNSQLLITVPQTAEDLTKYHITLNKNISTIGGKTLSSNKKIDILTGGVVATLVSSVPANNAKNIDIFSGVTVGFSEAIDPLTVTANNVQITSTKGDTPLFKATVNELDNTKINIEFAKELKHEATYTVAFAGVKAQSGNKVKAFEKIAFTTNTDPVRTVYFNNFDDGQMTGLTIAGGNPQVVEGKLQMFSPAFAENRVMIAGSDNWSDYVASYDASAVRVTNAHPIFFLRQKDGKGFTSWVDYNASQRIVNGPAGYGQLASGSNFAFVDGTNYHNEISAIGQQITWKQDGEVVVSFPFAEFLTGAFGLANYQGNVSFDNLKVEYYGDDMLSYTSSNLKNLLPGDSVLITFNKEMDAATLDTSAIVVKSGENVIPVTATVQGNIVKITLPEGTPENAKLTVNVGKNVLKTTVGATTLPNDKSFSITTGEELSIAAANLKNSVGEIKDFSTVTTNDNIFATVNVEYKKAGTQSVTLVLAVYNANDQLLNISNVKRDLTASDGLVTMETPSFKLKDNLNGDYAKIYVIDDFVNIIPLSNCVPIY